MLLTDFTPLGELQAQLALNDLDGALESLSNASQLEPNDGKQMVISKTSMP
jgi:cytochrome c-type biogenesis protein CcmH/NrfG